MPTIISSGVLRLAGFDRVRMPFGGVYVFPITSCWPCAPFCYSPVPFLHIGLSFICLIAHSAHCAILIRCDIVKSDAIFFILFSPFLHIFCAPPVQWVQLLRFLFVASIDMPWIGLHILAYCKFVDIQLWPHSEFALISRLSMTIPHLCDARSSSGRDLYLDFSSERTSNI